MTTTRFKERDRVTNQAKMNKKRMKMMRILIYGGMNVIEPPPSTYEPYFYGKWYVSQLFGVEMGKNMKNTRSLNSIYVNAIFTQLLQT